MEKNSIVLASVLNKIHNDICYHRVRESQDAVTPGILWIPGEYNIANLLTKNKIIGNTRHKMVESMFYNKAVVIRDKYGI